MAQPQVRVEKKLDRFGFEAAVVADAGGWASDAERAVLTADPLAWAAAVRRLIHETDDGIQSAAGLTGDLRTIVLSDLMDERARLSAVLLRLTGDEIDVPQSASLDHGNAPGIGATTTGSANGLSRTQRFHPGRQRLARFARFVGFSLRGG